MMERVNPDSPSLYLSLTGVRGMVSMSILPWCLDRKKNACFQVIG